VHKIYTHIYLLLQGAGGLTALLLGDVRVHKNFKCFYSVLITFKQGEDDDEEEEEEFEEGGVAGAQTAPLPATPSAGTKRALDETEEEDGQVANGGGEDNGAKKVKTS